MLSNILGFSHDVFQCSNDAVRKRCLMHTGSKICMVCNCYRLTEVKQYDYIQTAASPRHTQCVLRSSFLKVVYIYVQLLVLLVVFVLCRNVFKKRNTNSLKCLVGSNDILDSVIRSHTYIHTYIHYTYIHTTYIHTYIL